MTRGDREKRGSAFCQGYRGHREVSGKMCGELKGRDVWDVWIAVTNVRNVQWSSRKGGSEM